jgi:hypothetical protein
MRRVWTSRAAKVRTILVAACAVYAWSLLTAFGVFGAAAQHTGTTGAAAAAYQYEYANGSVTGSGRIASSTTFGLSASADLNGVKGDCSVVDTKTKDRFKCLTVTSVVIFDLGGVLGANIVGTGALNGTPMNYLIAASDLGEPGVGSDTFFLCASPGQTCYANPAAAVFKRNGVLTSGNIQIHS